MSVYVNKDTKVLVQGITGEQGSFHAKLMLEYGTQVVAGVTPGKAGQEVHGVPVYDSIKDALREHDVDWTCSFVPAKFARKAAMEAIDNSLHQVIITEGMPVHDVLDVVTRAPRDGVKVIGPNCPGITSVKECKIGIMPNHLFEKGSVGLISRSGTLTYEILQTLSKNGLGQSTALGIGGDQVIGTTFLDALKAFDYDNRTEKIVLVGEIGGNLEEQVAAYLKDHNYDKPIVAYIAGRTAPKGKRMGHAGAIITGSTGSAESKIKALESAGIKVARLPSELPELLNES